MFPTTQINTTNLDGSNDVPANARADLLAAVQALNAIIAGYNGAGGVPILSSSGKLPGGMYDGVGVLKSLLAVDGVGSGLDADTVDGKNASAFPLVDGTRGFAMGPDVYLPVSSSSGYTNASTPWLRVWRGRTGAAANGFGTSIETILTNGAGNYVLASRYDTQWSNAASGAEQAVLTLWSAVGGGGLQAQISFEAQRMLINEVSSPGTPGTGQWYLYAKSGGIYAKGSGGTEMGPFASGGGGVTAHGALTGLGNDDHTQYVILTGARPMTGDLDLGAHCLMGSEQASNPSNPVTGKWKLFWKSTGLYTINSAGAVVGPLGAGGGGVTAHSALTGLGADDHTQYVLRQPTAATIINSSQGDFDWTFESQHLASLLALDASNDTVYVNAALGTSPLGTLHAIGNSTLSALYGESGSNAPAIYGRATATNPGLCGRNTAAGQALLARRGTISETITTGVAEIESGPFDTPNSAGTGLGLLISQFLQNGSAIRVLDADGSGTMRNVFDLGVINAAGRSGPLGLVINNDAQDFDVRMAGATNANLFYLDASNDQIFIAGFGGSARLNINAVGHPAIYAMSTGGWDVAKFAADTGTAVLATTSSTGTAVMGLVAGTGRAGWFSRDYNSAGAQAVLEVDATEAGDDAAAILVRHSGVGPYLRLAGASDDVFTVNTHGELAWRELSSDPAGSPTSGNLYAFPKTDGTTYGLWTKSSDGFVAPIASQVFITDVTLTGASVTVTDAIPPGALIGVTYEVLTAVTGCSGINVGLAETTNLFAANATALTVGQRSTCGNSQARTVSIYPAGESVIVEAVGGTFTAGVIRIRAQYIPVM